MRTSRSMSLVLVAVLVLGAAALAAVAGCSSTGADPLNGTKWRLSGWSISSIDPASVTITAQFAEGQISGSGGVNSYGGPYTLGPASGFKVGEIVSTLMAGPEPAMRAESAYMALLGQARSYAVEGDTLTLFDAGGNQSLIFERAAR